MNLDDLKKRVDKNIIGSESLKQELEELEKKLQDPSVWADQKLASELGQKVREIKEKIVLFDSWESVLEDAEIAYVYGESLQEFRAFAKALIAEMFDTYETITFEADDCDEFAMGLRSMFANRGEESFDTYIRQK